MNYTIYCVHNVGKNVHNIKEHLLSIVLVKIRSVLTEIDTSAQ